MAQRDPRAIAEDRVGQVLNGKWRIDRLLDVGGMAAVYGAAHRNGKRVAIKILNPAIAANADLRGRFLREGYAANKVVHRGAVQVLDDDVAADGAAFIVMELLEGQSLERRMHNAPGGRLPIPEVLGIADQVLDTLAAFHASGVIHRDIKPGNLFITADGVIKVLDFGLARMRDSSTTGSGAPATGVGMVLGTATYMPPEQALGKSEEVDARADLFAVGAVMFHAISGRSFTRGKTPMERVLYAMREPAPPLASFVPGVPDFISTVVDTALAFDKKDRWSDANSMRAAVRVAFSAIAHHVKRRSMPPPVPGPRKVEAPKLSDVAAQPAPRIEELPVEASAAPAPPSAMDLSVAFEDGPASSRDASSVDVIPLVAVRSRTGVPPPLPHADAQGDGGDHDDPVSIGLLDDLSEPSLVVDVSFGGLLPAPNASGKR